MTLQFTYQISSTLSAKFVILTLEEIVSNSLRRAYNGHGKTGYFVKTIHNYIHISGYCQLAASRPCIPGDRHNMDACSPADSSYITRTCNSDYITREYASNDGTNL